MLLACCPNTYHSFIGTNDYCLLSFKATQARALSILVINWLHTSLTVTIYINTLQFTCIHDTLPVWTILRYGHLFNRMQCNVLIWNTIIPTHGININEWNVYVVKCTTTYNDIITPKGSWCYLATGESPAGAVAQSVLSLYLCKLEGSTQPRGNHPFTRFSVLLWSVEHLRKEN